MLSGRRQLAAAHAAWRGRWSHGERALRRCALALVCLIVLAPSISVAARASEPVLRIDGQRHSGRLIASDVDAAGELLVTASLDKTVRLWAIPRPGEAAFRLLQTFRPPIADGAEGKLFSVALSPARELVAAAGVTGPSLDPAGGYVVYVFDRATGLMRARVGGFDGPVTALAFSPDGKILAAASGAQGTVRLFETAAFTERHTLADHKGRIFGLAFDDRGRLATASFDGDVRLYSPSFEPLAKHRAGAGERPSRIAFSPDDTRLAVGFADRPLVAVLDAPSLEIAATLEAPDLEGGSLIAVAWSADGRQVLAGGRSRSSDGSAVIVRRFDLAAGARVADVAVSEAAVTSLHALRDGRVMFTAQDPAFGIVLPDHTLGPRERSGLVVPPEDDPLVISHDGLTVGVPLAGTLGDPGAADAGPRLMLVDVAAREVGVVAEAPATPRLVPARQAHPSLAAEIDFKGAAFVNGAPVELEPGETAQAFAVAADGTGVVIGTDDFLRRHGADARPLWRVPVPAGIVRVAISGDGRLLAALREDGTLVWHRADDGSAVVSLFALADDPKSRWVLWAPTGHYVSGPGAADLLGWHVNLGADRAAAFYGASRFRAQYRRPDVIGQLAATRDPAKALEAADKARGKNASAALSEALPPIVRIVRPIEGVPFSGEPLGIDYVLESPSGKPIGSVKALLDGRPFLTIAAPPAATSEPQRLELSGLPPFDARLSLMAVTADGPGEPDTVDLTYAGPPSAEPIMPNLYALIVGVGTCADPTLAPLTTAGDAEALAETLRSLKGKAYGGASVRLLTGDVASRTNILAGLRWLRDAPKPGDLAVVYLGGYGVTARDGRSFFLGADAQLADVAASAVAAADIRDAVAATRGRVLVLLDGRAPPPVKGLAAPELGTLAGELALPEVGAAAMISSGRPAAASAARRSRSPFVTALIEAFSGQPAADADGRGTVTVDELADYLAARMAELDKTTSQPLVVGSPLLPDFAIATAHSP